MNLKTLFLAAFASLALAAPANSADVEAKRRVHTVTPNPQHLCLQGKRIFTDLSYGEIVAAVTAYHDEAVAAVEQSQFSRTMRYNWALETKAWCGSAIGYSWTRTLEEETVAKCACFHYTMIRQR